jgi:N-methylhydantoinase B/oxoprolinase/acetone carboxylase alpha subunit
MATIKSHQVAVDDNRWQIENKFGETLEITIDGKGGWRFFSMDWSEGEQDWFSTRITREDAAQYWDIPKTLYS